MGSRYLALRRPQLTRGMTRAFGRSARLAAPGLCNAVGPAGGDALSRRDSGNPIIHTSAQPTVRSVLKTVNAGASGDGRVEPSRPGITEVTICGLLCNVPNRVTVRKKTFCRIRPMVRLRKLCEYLTVH